MIMEEAQGDPLREKELREENPDRLRPLPEAHYKTVRNPSPGDQHLAVPTGLGIMEVPHMPPHPTLHEKRRSRSLSLDISSARQSQAQQMEQLSEMQNPQQFDFGLSIDSTEFEKNLMRLPSCPRPSKLGRAAGVPNGSSRHSIHAS